MEGRVDWEGRCPEGRMERGWGGHCREDAGPLGSRWR